MPPVPLVARALAEAFLAGAWERARLIERGETVLGHRPPWLPRTVARALREFPTPPDDADALTQLLRRLTAIRRGAHDLIVRRWLLPEPRMRRAEQTPAFAVPELSCAGDVARWLDLGAGELAWFADVRRLGRRTGPGPLRHYHYRWLHKGEGYLRLVEAPRPRLKELQRKLLAAVLDPVTPHPAAHGFRRGRSVLTYVAPHVAQTILMRFDLRDFFASVRASRIHALFRTLGYPREVARLLTGLCTNAVPPDAWSDAPPASTPGEIDARWRARRFYAAPHLPAGAPTSPALANLAARRLDVRLGAAAQAVGASYTRYADDLAFSGGPDFARRARRFRDLVHEIVSEEGFTLNARKTRMVRSGARQSLGGLVVNARPNIARHEYDRLKAIVHNCVRHGPAGQNRKGHADFRAWLSGRVAWLASVHPERGQRLREQLAAIDWSC